MNDHLAQYTTLNGLPLTAIQADAVLKAVIEQAARRIAEIRGLELAEVKIQLKERQS